MKKATKVMRLKTPKVINAPKMAEAIIEERC